MHLLSSIKNWVTDFIFPRSQRVMELEALSVSDILETLPPAKRIETKGVSAIFDYNHPVTKNLIWELKYEGNRRIAEKLGAILHDVICQELSDLALFDSVDWKKEKPFLIPIPISDKRRFERGWNQTELLCKAILKNDGTKNFIYLPWRLLKTRHSESQTKTSSGSARLRNIMDSMQIADGADMTNRCVVIIDDVTTTGSTFAEARRALCAAGIKKILCIAVAH